MKPDYFALQVRQRFFYLFDQYGFAVIHEEHHSQNDDHAIIVLESPDCRIRILLEREQVLIDIGPLSAPEDWSTSAPNDWFGLTYVTGFLSNGTDRWEYAKPETALDRNLRIDQQLVKLANRLRPYCDLIFSAFRPEAFEQTQQALLIYQEQQVEMWLNQYRPAETLR